MKTNPHAENAKSAEMNTRQKPYGFEVTVMFHNRDLKTFHYVGSETAAKRKAMLKTLADHVVSTSPVTHEQWVRTYGDPKLRM